MGWAKFEEDNREARTERFLSGNTFYKPYENRNIYSYYTTKVEAYHIPQHVAANTTAKSKYYYV